MKNRSSSQFQLAAVGAACVALAMGLQGCGSSGSPEPVIITVPSAPPVAVITSVAKYQVVLRNASTGALITDATAIAISGAAAVDSTNTAVTTINTSTGLASFSTAPGVAAGATLRVNTTSRAAGWADGAATVTVTASGDVQLITISLANTNQVAAINASTAPVAAAAASATVTAGVIVGGLTASTPAKTVTSVTGAAVVLPPATAAIPATAQLTTAAGVPATGALTLSVVSPSVSTSAGLAAFPSGFGQITTAGAPAGAATTGLPVVAGIITTTLTDSAGNRITNFSQPVTVRIPVDAGTTKVDDSGPLVVGDTFPVYVWNETTSQWNFQVNSNIVAVGTGLAAEFPTSTFSRRALIKLRPISAATSCTSTVGITGRGASTEQLSAEIIGTSGGRFSRTANTNGASFGSFTFPTARLATGATGVFGTINITDSKGVRVGGGAEIDLCVSPTVAVTLPQPATGSIVVSTTEQCANGTNAAPVPTAIAATGPNNLVLSGSSSATGAFTFTGLAAGTYSVTANGARTGVAPQTQAVTVAAGAANANFVFTRPCTTVVTSGG